MSDFEIILACMLIPIGYVLIYIAGKYDILSLICKKLQETVDEYANREKWKDAGDPVEDLKQIVDDYKTLSAYPAPCHTCLHAYPNCGSACYKLKEYETLKKKILQEKRDIGEK